MAGVVGAAVFLDRVVAPLRALALAAILIALMQPGAPADVSFQLSFVSVAALIVGASGGDAGDRPRPARWLGGLVRASLAAWIGTAPLTAFHFHQVSLVSVVANPLVIPLFEGASVLPALVGAVLAPVAPSLAGWLFAAAGVPVRAALGLVRVLAAWPWAAADVPLPSLGELGLLYGAIGGALAGRMYAGRVVLAACLGALAVDAGWWAHERTSAASSRATFLDVGQGDAAVVELAGGRVLVIDAGGFPGSDFDTGAAIVEPFLRARKVARVDALVMSHAHPDHAGGLAHLVRQFAPAEVWWAGIGGVGTAWDDVVRALRETGTPVRILHAGATIPDFPEITVLHPTAAWPARSLNDASLVLRVVVGPVAMLFTGDAERDAEAAMLHGGGDLTALVLKVPHHGSHTSSTAPFVAAVAPALAVVSVGAENRFGHPAPDVVARYARNGIVLRRTDQCGAIAVVAVTGGLDVSSARPACPPTLVRMPPPP
jgi:competence protein ComEC